MGLATFSGSQPGEVGSAGKRKTRLVAGLLRFVMLRRTIPCAIRHRKRESLDRARRPALARSTDLALLRTDCRWRITALGETFDRHLTLSLLGPHQPVGLATFSGSQPGEVGSAGKRKTRLVAGLLRFVMQG